MLHALVADRVHHFARAEQVAREDEVVPVRGVDDRVRRDRAGPQAVEILERSAMHIRSGRGDRGGGGVRASEPDELMPAPMSSTTMAEPIQPGAPVTKMRGIAEEVSA